MRGGIPASAHSNREWHSNRIDFHNGSLLLGGAQGRAHSNRERQSNFHILIASRMYLPLTFHSTNVRSILVVTYGAERRADRSEVLVPTYQCTARCRKYALFNKHIGLRHFWVIWHPRTIVLKSQWSVHNLTKWHYSRPEPIVIEKTVGLVGNCQDCTGTRNCCMSQALMVQYVPGTGYPTYRRCTAPAVAVGADELFLFGPTCFARQQKSSTSTYVPVIHMHVVSSTCLPASSGREIKNWAYARARLLAARRSYV